MKQSGKKLHVGASYARSARTLACRGEKLPAGGWKLAAAIHACKIRGNSRPARATHTLRPFKRRAIEATIVKNDSFVARFYESPVKACHYRPGCGAPRANTLPPNCSAQQIPNDLPLNFMNLYSIRLTYLFHLNASPGRMTNPRTRNVIVKTNELIRRRQSAAILIVERHEASK